MKLKTLLTLAIASICSWESVWADRVVPTFPSDQAKTLESGGTYYLYNPGSDRFIYRNGSTINANASSYSALYITNVEGDVYNMLFDGSDYYFYSSGNNFGASNSSNNNFLNYRKFRIDATEGGYTIQRNYDYNETYFVGNATGNSNVYSNFTAGNIVWQFYDADGAAAIVRYRAKKALYDALVSAEDYSFAVEQYEALYANDNATNDELTSAANTINNALMWKDKLTNGESEYPIYIELAGNATWYYYTNNGNYSYTTIKNGEGGLKATLEVDQDATLVYDYHLADTWTGYGFNVYLDGELYQNIFNYEGNDDQSSTSYYQRFFVELTAGRHVIEWKAKSTSEETATTFYLKGIAAYMTPTISVNLTQAGSLGTEILYNVDHIKEVRKLVVKGNMNSDDFERINMMTNLFDLDLTETTVTSLSVINPGEFFHKIKLPARLSTIEESAFANIPLDEISFPTTLTSIGSGSFRYTRIKEAIMPETVTSVGAYAFASNQSLNKVVWPTQVKSIPNNCFDGDRNIHTLDLPEGLTSIGNYAFRYNYYCNYQLPSTIQSIGHYAFTYANKLESIYIPANTAIGAGAFYCCNNLKKVIMGEGCSYSRNVSYYHLNNTKNPSSMPGTNTFNGCNNLEEIEFPTTFYRISSTNMLSGCTALKKVTFKSPTLIDGDEYNTFFSGLGTDIQVYVPSYLVNAYKLDKYWYNYNIMGFSTADVTKWNINNTLTFYSRDRFEGTPDVNLQVYGVWTINGDLTQNIGNFTTWYNSQEYDGGVGSVSKIISNCDNVTINGSYTHGYYVFNKYKSGSSTYNGRWHFICLPFDIKVSDITTTDNARFAIRYYDGANRAQNGTGGNWKDYASDDIISAGTGFIVQCSKACRIYFNAQDNESKQNVVSNKIFTKSLDANDSEQSSNKGWNLVGNPWLCYYNIHKLNFTGPITTYNGYTRTYTAYSMIDDDYAIRPNQAFFVQCPDEVTEISFPVDGRQMTSVIESQNGVRAEQPSVRKLIDVEISDGEQSDKARFVMNPQASVGYEMQRDASKFFEEGTSVPQIYTIESGEMLAINERPIGEGTVQIGLRIAANGTYTITAPRCQFQSIVLVDNETGIETELANGGIYTFTANTGCNDSRFMLRVSNVVITNINSLKQDNALERNYYNLNGQRISAPQKGLYIVNGKKVMK